MSSTMEMVHFIPPSRRRMVLEAALADHLPVLILGGSGTGKGAIARWIHHRGPRAAMPFLTLEAENHGLVTGFQEAHGGTLVLSEVEHFSKSEQKLIAHYLKTKTLPLDPFSGVVRLFNVRVILTASPDWNKSIQDGRVVPELAERVKSGYLVDMPPLLERGDEFEDIALGILREITRETQRQYIRGFTPDALETLQNYSWPGNLRELRNALRLAVIKAQGSWIDRGDLPTLHADRTELRSNREQFEKTYLQELLKVHGGEVEAASRAVHMEPGLFRHRLKIHDIEFSSPANAP